MLRLPAWAAWTPGGAPICTASNDEWQAVTVPDASGGAIVIWSDRRSGSLDIYAQRLDGFGNTLWAANGVPVCTATGDQALPVAVSDGVGGAVIAWVDARFGDLDVFVGRITAAGVPAPGWVAGGRALSTSTLPDAGVCIASDGASGAFVAWQRTYSASDVDPYLSHVTSSGAIVPGFSADGNPLSTLTADQDGVTVASDGGSGAFVAWSDDRGSSRDIYASHVTSSGTLAPGNWTTQGLQVSSDIATEDEPVVVSDWSGGCIIAWRGNLIRAQRLDAGGVFQWGPSGQNLSNPFYGSGKPAAFSDVSGVYVTWLTGPTVSVQHLLYDGSIAPGFPLYGLSAGTGSSPGAPRIADAHDGGAFVTWEAQSLDSDLYGQQISASGLKAFRSGGLPICQTIGNQYYTPIRSMAPAWDGGSGAILAWEDNRTPGSRLVYVDRLRPGNLVGASVPSGWSSPAVPRASGDATPTSASLSPTLPGGAGSTWFNWNLVGSGPSTPAWQGRLLLDEQEIATVQIPEGTGAVDQKFVNVGPFTVRGGRHSLRQQMDFGQSVFETNEGDNDWTGQWVWSPVVLSREVPLLRPAPPMPGTLPIPNSDGFQFTRNSSYAWVTSIMPVMSGDDYDLVVFNDYSNSSSGFSNVLKTSRLSSTSTDFVVGHYSGTPITMYPAIVRYAANNAGGCWIDPTDAAGRNANHLTAESGSWTETLGTGRLANVYELNALMGRSYLFRLERTSGSSDLALEVFSGSAGSVYGRGEGIAQSVQSPDADILTFTAPANGWYPIVVFRTNGAQGADAMNYKLWWESDVLIDVPVQPVWELAFGRPEPNPAGSDARFRFTLPARTNVRLELFDLTGRRVRTLVDRVEEAGPHAAVWDRRDDQGIRVDAGIYWARLTVGDRRLVRKLALLH